MGKALPARRVYYDWDPISTSPDLRLGSAFEETGPGLVEPRRSFGDDEITLTDWALPALALAVVGFFVGRWWAGRKPSSPTVIAGDGFGFDLLGAE